MGRTWSGIFCKNSKKHYYTSGADAETGRNATLFYMYFSPEENEQTIEFLLQEYPQFKICDIKGYEGFSDGILKASLSGNEQLKKTIRIFPHKMEGEGHFIALLKKEEEAVSENLKEKEKNNRNKNEKEKRLPDELTEFLKNVKRKFDSSRIDMRGENVYYMPEGLPKLNGVRFLRSGLLLGELKKGVLSQVRRWL